MVSRSTDFLSSWRRGFAAANRRQLWEHAAMLFQLNGLPGSGRTALLAATLRRLTGHANAGVILGNAGDASERRQMAEYCDQLMRVDAPEVAAEGVREALGQMDLSRLEWLFCEGTATTEPDDELDVGQDVTVAVFGVSGGDDKAATVPSLAAKASAVVLTQIDLLPHLPFRLERFERDLRQVNAAAPLFALSVIHGTGMEDWMQWLHRFRRFPPGGEDPGALFGRHGEWYLG